MSGDPQELPRLGSLAQAARGKQLRQARNLLIWIGVLTILFNGVMLFLIPGQIDAEIKKEVNDLQAKGMQADPVQIQSVRDHAMLISFAVTGIVVFLGVLFVFFGVLVNRFPVPITVTALVLYVATAAGFALLDPTTIGQGIILKVIVVVGLVKAIQAAVAYQRETAAGDLAMESSDD